MTIFILTNKYLYIGTLPIQYTQEQINKHAFLVSIKNQVYQIRTFIKYIDLGQIILMSKPMAKKRNETILRDITWEREMEGQTRR